MDNDLSNVTGAQAVRTRFAWRAGYILATLALYFADQASKAWAVRSLRFGDERVLIPGFMKFFYTENPGIAFGQLQEGGSFSRWFFVVLAVAAAIAVFYYFLRTPRNDDRVLGACALLLAGISGNLTDRIRLGYVVDFIGVFIGSYQWPSFNVADAAICTGAALLALDLILEGRKEGREEGKRQKAKGKTQKEEPALRAEDLHVLLPLAFCLLSFALR